jgi:hypothetical protein
MAAAVLLHPHPDYGGNQYNNVVTAFFDRWSAIGLAPRRFDFISSDVETARQQTIDAIDRAGGPLWLMGYSFGGAIAATIDHPSVLGWCLVAPALTLANSTIGADPRAKYVIAGEHDTMFGPAAVLGYTAEWTATSHATVPATDHFFSGGAADYAADLATGWVEAHSADGSASPDR